MSPDLELRTVRAMLSLASETILAIAPAPGIQRPRSSNSDECSALKDLRDAVAHLDSALGEAGPPAAAHR